MGTSPNTIPDNNGSTIILFIDNVSQALPTKAQLGFSQKYNNSIKNCQIFICKNDSEVRSRLKWEQTVA